MIKHDGKHERLRVCRAAGLVGVSIREYRSFEVGERSPDFETWDGMCKLYGWAADVCGLVAEAMATGGCNGADPDERGAAR
jgi:hypothetical protein